MFPEVMTGGGVLGPRQWRQLPQRPDSGVTGWVQTDRWSVGGAAGVSATYHDLGWGFTSWVKRRSCFQVQEVSIVNLHFWFSFHVYYFVGIISKLDSNHMDELESLFYHYNLFGFRCINVVSFELISYAVHHIWCHLSQIRPWKNKIDQIMETN